VYLTTRVGPEHACERVCLGTWSTVKDEKESNDEGGLAFLRPHQILFTKITTFRYFDNSVTFLKHRSIVLLF
jgi:hypothetical protein